MMLMDMPDKLNLYGYIFLRRIAAAVLHCGEAGVIPPVIVINKAG